MKDSLKPGLKLTQRFMVTHDNTIGFMGEALRVYATPAMVLDIERSCRELLMQHADPGEDSVGARVEIDHLGPTLIGMWVDVTVTVAEVDGQRVTFEAEVHDALDLVGRARHIRFVVDTERQRRRLEKKQQRAEDAAD
ncbi:MAG TPA: thioesterase family protein [Alphaproteobacteria bacterium]|jgi:predicted thioesterase|nr:thioesterase family protein [Alphaproteobacteria bacterium]